jgi:bifunctional oligoribonuclease and PAP phosphatase NrnA
MSSPQTTAPEIAAVAEAIRSNERFLVTTHENPDGDALGSLLAMKLALDRLGKDSVMYLGGEAPLPREYNWMPLGELHRRLPDDAGERVLLALDCANESRLGADAEGLLAAPLVVNIDHHHDNSRFGGINLVVADASSTGEVLRDVFDALGVQLTPEVAEALYIALVTDTGRFQYANTTPRALRLAAELVEAGADVHKVFQSVYESIEFAKLVRDDFKEVGAAEPYSEGIIDYLRAVEGADMAALIREPPRDDTVRRVSLRASNDELDVSEIARRSGQGGGHRQAAGFSTEQSIDEIVETLRREFAAAAHGRRG